MTAQQFVLELGRAMHALGSPAYRVEDTMDACARALGLQGSFFATPTAIFAGLGRPGEEPRTHLLRVAPGEHDLGRLAALYAIRDDVTTAMTTPTRGLLRVREVMGHRTRPSHGRELLAHVLAGGGAAVLFGGGGHEVLVAGSAGFLVGCLGLVSQWRPTFSDVQAPLACALVAFVVHLLAAAGFGLSVPIATIAAIVVLLPGLSFTTALAELSMRHLSSGSARLLGTVAVLLSMAIGVGLGDRAAELLVGRVPATTGEASWWGWQVPGLVATWIAYSVLLRAERRQFGWVLLGVACGYGGARLGRETLGPELGAFVGALLVTIAGNLFSRFKRRPSAVVRTPGLLLLVPGSLGYRSLATAVAGDFARSAEFLFQMLLVGGSIVAGLLIAGVLVPPPLAVEPDSRLRSFGP
ncbi:MAG: threonine/serine exporter family protein [Planctomycetes bacterium]|nr:threonine/serine exporter family protein [Planctomycetota bacterium]